MDPQSLGLAGYDRRYVPTGHLLFARAGNLTAGAADQRGRLAAHPGVLVAGRSFACDLVGTRGRSYRGLSLEGQGEVEWLPARGGNVFGASLSPDARHAAYFSDETGQAEIWVCAVSGPPFARQVSLDGGTEARRSRGEILYRKGRQWLAARVTSLQPHPTWDPPRVVFETGL